MAPEFDRDMAINSMLNETHAQTSLPRYKCHKEVWALKIAKLEPDLNQKPTIEQLDKILNEETDNKKYVLMTPENKMFLPIWLDIDYINKHKPKVGGYYVVYKDGYKSFSPADVFEEGYTRV